MELRDDGRSGNNPLRTDMFPEGGTVEGIVLDPRLVKVGVQKEPLTARIVWLTGISLPKSKNSEFKHIRSISFRTNC